MSDEKKPAITATCPCGHEVPVTLDEKGDYDVCGLQCPKCYRHSDGGNYITGELSGWVTAESREQSQQTFEAMQFDCDMNEWYGRGEW